MLMIYKFKEIDYKIMDPYDAKHLGLVRRYGR